MIRAKKFLICVLLITFSFTLIPQAHAKKTYHRIISLSPTATEDLFAIGAGNKILAVSSDSNYPANAPRSSLDAFMPNLEAIVAMRPDLVILNNGATKAGLIKTGLEKLKIVVYLENAPDSLDGVYKEIFDLGSLSGNTSGAYAVVTSMKVKISKALAYGRKVKNVSFFHELDNTLYSATSSTFIGSVYKSFGFTNIADAGASSDSYGYPQLTAEFVIKSNPRYIFLADAQYGENISHVAKRPGWGQLSAVTGNRVIELPEDIHSRWSPRLADFYIFISNIVRHEIPQK